MYTHTCIRIQTRAKTAAYPLLLTRPESQCKHTYPLCMQYVSLNIMLANMFCWVLRMIFRTLISLAKGLLDLDVSYIILFC